MTIEFQSPVDDDGILVYRPLGAMDAGAEVVVTIRRVPHQQPSTIQDSEQWHRAIDESYGSCATLGLERQSQGQFEVRERFE